MNINPLRMLTRGARSARGKSNDMSTSVVARAQQSLGVWQGALTGFIARQVNPWFYMALREALGPIDGGIDRLVTMDGIIDVQGDNDKLVQAIQNDLIRNIPVNDMEAGLQAFYAAQGDMMLEQGFAVGEVVLDKRGRELVGLRLADSKGAVFHREGTQLQTWYRPPIIMRYGRRDGTDAVETVIRNNGPGISLSGGYLTEQGFALLDPATLVYGAFNATADNPYGVSIMRGIEFVSQILVKIQNATGNAWDRFGDPSFHLLYKAKNRALRDDDFNKRQKQLAADLQAVLNAKRSGNSADLVQAIGADDDVVLNVVGADNTELQLEMPANHMMQQILARFGLPAWMEGVESSRGSSALGDQQSEMVIQASKTRFDRRRPGLEKIIATWLRGRGLTWKPGDWQVTQRLPNLYDELKRAQAGFLQAQTQMMLAGRLQGGGNLGGNDGGMGASTSQAGKQLPRVGARVPLGQGMHVRVPHTHAGKAAGDPNSEDDDPAADPAPAEPWAEPDPQLPIIETAAINALQTEWRALYQRTYQTLRLSDSGAATFTFDAANMLTALGEDQEWFIAHAGAQDGPYMQQVFAAWARGIVNAAADINLPEAGDAAIEQVLQDLRAAIAHRGLSQVRTTALRTYADDIVATLQQGIYDGQNPKTVAAALKARFDVHDYDWLRLARSEIASAQGKGKLQSYIRNGRLQYDFVTAPGACSICDGLAAAGPYMAGMGPMPVDDSHPLCRCSILARAPVTPPA
jgi:hypothetical protein